MRKLGLVAGIIILVLAIAGAYFYSIIPKAIGSPIVLQEELFKPGRASQKELKYVFRPAFELANMVKNREASSLDIVQEHINFIKANNYKYNSFIFLDEVQALNDAKKADELVASNDTLNMPLLGVPISIKEQYWVKGSPSTMNAKMFGFTAPRDAAIVSQLRSAGAIILGTTNVPYMLSDYQTQGEVYPTANNPFDTSRTPGGSTGGGASAVAAGLSTIELGADLGGSIRVPAVFCGLWSLKPSFGVVNISDGGGPDTTHQYSRFALASGGPLARTPEDVELMWNIIKNTKEDPKFPQPKITKTDHLKQLKDCKIAWTDEWNTRIWTAHVSAEMSAAMKCFIDSLLPKCSIVVKDFPSEEHYINLTKSFLASFGSMMNEGQPWLIRKIISKQFSEVFPGELMRAYESGVMEDTQENWEKIQTDRKNLISIWENFFTKYDFIVMPVTYDGAFKKQAPMTDIVADDGTKISYIAYFPGSYILNSTGHPAITVPLGLNSKGMPIGVQVVGPLYSENELLNFAKQVKSFVKGYIKPI